MKERSPGFIYFPYLARASFMKTYNKTLCFYSHVACYSTVRQTNMKVSISCNYTRKLDTVIYDLFTSNVSLAHFYNLRTKIEFVHLELHLGVNGCVLIMVRFTQNHENSLGPDTGVKNHHFDGASSRFFYPKWEDTLVKWILCTS